MTSKKKTWLVYVSLRLIVFILPLAILLALRITPWLATILAALIGAALSFLLLTKSRNAAALTIHSWRNGSKGTQEDALVEDLQVEDQQTTNTDTETETHADRRASIGSETRKTEPDSEADETAANRDSTAATN